MSCHPANRPPSGRPPHRPAGGGPKPARPGAWRPWLAILLAGLLPARPAPAVILWSDPGPRLALNNGAGVDLLAGAVKRDDTANDTLYFKFQVDPRSDKDTEEYFAGFELYEGDTERLGLGNSLKAWAYSAFLHANDAADASAPAGPVDLHSAKPESATVDSYQYPRRGVRATIVFKVQYIPGEDDLVTVWLNPDLGPGANEADQPDSLTTRFNADASFDEVRLRHGGRGGGWWFADLSIATAFSDFVDASSTRSSDPAASEISDARALGFRAWEKAQGLPPDPIRALAQTREGYLWLGGDDGLVRFDGLRFVPLGSADGGYSGPVAVLRGDRMGGLWIGSRAAGLSHWQNGQLQTFTTREGLPDNGITALAEDAAGRLWVGTRAGLARLQAGRLTGLPPAQRFSGRQINALWSGPQGDGELWVAVRDAGVFQLTGRQAALLPDTPRGDGLKDARSLLLDHTGRLWVGTADDTVCCWEPVNRRWESCRIPHGRMTTAVTTLAEEGDGTIWAGAEAAGLWHLQNGQAVAVPGRAGLAGASVTSLMTDQAGRLWVGTEAGLNRLHREGLFALSQGEGLGAGAVQGMAEVAPGVVWVGKPGDGLLRWNGRSFGRLAVAGLTPPDSRISALLVARNGFCWVATTNSLWLCKDSVAVADETTRVTSAPAGITALAEDQQGGIWAGTRQGAVLRLAQNQWRAAPDWTQTRPITALLSAPDGSIWAATAGDGVFHFLPRAVRHLGRRDGLASENIQSLCLDHQGALWISTSGGGLSRWYQSSLVNFSDRAGLPSAPVTEILEDDFNRLWLGTSQGIFCVKQTELAALAAGRIARVHPAGFGLAEGMRSTVCAAAGFPACLRTTSGKLWFATGKGVVVVDPAALPGNPLPPPTELEEVLVDGVAMPLPPPPGEAGAMPGRVSGALRASPGQHRVEFRFTGLNYAAPEQIRFRYRLEGLDADWVEAGTRRTALYSYLPPGRYEFRVEAAAAAGAWSDNRPALELLVPRHYWQTWWFVAATGASLMVLVGAAVRLVVRGRLQRRLRLLEQERALERERTRIARDLHDEMGAKLCRISYLSEHARRARQPSPEWSDQINSISEVSREVLHSLDEIVWAVNPQNDSLEHLASYLGQYAQEYFQMTGIHCELDIPPRLPAHPLSSQTRHHLFMAAHEALTNILKHSGATRATITVASPPGSCQITIADNGRGFDLAAMESRLASPVTAAGDGLTNMRRRLGDLGGQYRIESQPGQGTRIVFVIPLNRHPGYAA